MAIKRQFDGASRRHERIAPEPPDHLSRQRVADTARPASGISGSALCKASLGIALRRLDWLLLQEEIRTKPLILLKPIFRR